MPIVKATNLACPIDGEKLATHENHLACENGHSFDIARQGYVNLLPVQHKRSKHPGDSKAMVTARNQFLNSGIYEPLATELTEIISELLLENNEICILDAGCGEGYYIDKIFNALDKIDHVISFVGLDISKHAIIEAAKRNKQINWIVGTNRQPPVLDNSVDIVLCVFGFQNFKGFNKILKPGGKIILVEAGVDHLKELRQIIYTEVKKSGPPDLSYLEKSELSLVDTQHLQFKTQLIENKQVNNLLIMTPHLYRAKKEGREVAGKLQNLDITVDVVFRTLQKNH